MSQEATPIPTGPQLFRTPRLHLRTCQPRDAPSYLRINTNPENIRYEPHSDASKPLSHYEENMRKDREAALEGKSNFMAVCMSAPSGDEVDETGEITNDEMIGMGGFNSIHARETGERVANTGVMIDSAYWRKGFGSEVMSATIDYAFDVLRVDLVELETLEGNDPFLALAGKMGFRDLGVFRGMKGAAGADWIFEITRKQWESVVQAMGKDQRR